MRDAYEPAADDVRSDAPDGPEELDGFNPYGSGPVPLRLRPVAEQHPPHPDKIKGRQAS